MSTEENPLIPPPDNDTNTAPSQAPPAGRKICPGCGTSNQATSQYCYKCGLKLPDIINAGIVKPGGFWIRFVAYLIDAILLNVVNSVVFFIFLGVFGTSIDWEDWFSTGGMDIYSGDFAIFSGAYSLALLVSFVITAGYYTFAVGKWGKTVGKLATGLKVVRPDGSRVSYWRAFARYWGYQLCILTFWVGFLVIAFNKDKRGLHDLVCDTMVIRT